MKRHYVDQRQKTSVVLDIFFQCKRGGNQPIKCREDSLWGFKRSALKRAKEMAASYNEEIHICAHFSVHRASGNVYRGSIIIGAVDPKGNYIEDVTDEELINRVKLYSI